MRAAILSTFTLLSATLAVRADFSYTTTTKTTGGMAASFGGGANNPPSKHYFKGQKMRTDSGDTSTIIDFDAQTLTIVNNRQKTVTVQGLRDIGAAAGANGASVKIDVKETGQQKTINGYNSKELVMTMEVEIPQAQQMGKMEMEMDLWLSSDVPGIGELKGFYQKNMERFPWAAMSGGGNQGMQAGIAQMQRKIAEVGGVQVESVMKMRSASGAGTPAMPQMSPAQQAQMQAAMARLQQQGGPQAAAAAQAMARMSGGAAPGASNSLMEITTDSSDFSTASIPDSVFAIPAGFAGASAIAPQAPLAPIAPLPPPAPDPVVETKSIEVGQTKDQVVAILGKPDKIIKAAGAKEIFEYKDLRVTFVNGKMTDAQ